MEARYQHIPKEYAQKFIFQKDKPKKKEREREKRIYKPRMRIVVNGIIERLFEILPFRYDGYPFRTEFRCVTRAL